MEALGAIAVVCFGALCMVATGYLLVKLFGE